MSQVNDVVIPSSGNVFADLGLPNAEARLAKAELARQVSAIIRERSLGSTAAGILGMSQPEMSALLSGRLAAFSLERLAHFLTLLGKDVEIVVREKSAAAPVGRLSVIAA